MDLGDRPARQWAVVDALTGGAGCVITTKGLTGYKCRSNMLVIRVLTRLPVLGRRKRSHEIDSEGSVSCDGELMANAGRVYSRGCGRQRFSFWVGSMDWRRCTPEWSRRRRHRRCSRLLSFLANDVGRHCNKPTHPTLRRISRIVAFSGVCAINKLRTRDATEAHAVSS